MNEKRNIKTNNVFNEIVETNPTSKVERTLLSVNKLIVTFNLTLQGIHSIVTTLAVKIFPPIYIIGWFLGFVHFEWSHLLAEAGLVGSLHFHKLFERIFK